MNYTRRLGQKKRIFGGWERRDRIVYNGKELIGYVKLTKTKGTMTETTHFNGREVPGADIYWLCRRNSLTVKMPENYNQPAERIAA